MILVKYQIIFDWYRKPTFSGRFLNFFSQHPLCQKRGTIIGLVDRVFHLSHPEFHEKNFNIIIDILLNNSYPLEFIFRILHERLKALISKSNNSKENREKEDTLSVPFFTVPFISNFSEKFRSITKDINVRLSYRSLNKLSSFIKTHKDSLPTQNKRNVVYKINCSSCEVSYVGQTGRQLHTRISEHKNQIKRPSQRQSVITEHRVESGHDFEWEKVEILDTEPIFSKRLTSEMLYIKRQRNGINMQTDTENLHQTYSNLVDKLPKL